MNTVNLVGVRTYREILACFNRKNRRSQKDSLRGFLIVLLQDAPTEARLAARKVVNNQTAYPEKVIRLAKSIVLKAPPNLSGLNTASDLVQFLDMYRPGYRFQFTFPEDGIENILSLMVLLRKNVLVLKRPIDAVLLSVLRERNWLRLPKRSVIVKPGINFDRNTVAQTMAGCLEGIWVLHPDEPPY